MNADDAKRLKELSVENRRLKKAAGLVHANTVDRLASVLGDHVEQIEDDR